MPADGYEWFYGHTKLQGCLLRPVTPACPTRLARAVHRFRKSESAHSVVDLIACGCTVQQACCAGQERQRHARKAGAIISAADKHR